MKITLTALLASILLCGPVSSFAQNGQAQSSAESDFSTPSHAAMQKMQDDMMKTPMTGDPDHDFAAMMIPHHQGAIDMAKAYTEHGKDPKLVKMAKKMVSDQEREIKVLNKWLGSHKPKAK